MTILLETIDIAINYNLNLNITEKELKNRSLLLHYRPILFSTFFFHSKIDRVAQGSPLVPLLADIFMGF